jgi:hypothetical protein
VVSEKISEDDLSRVEESATKSTYKLGVGFERCEDKGENSALKFVPTSNYHKEEETIKSTKTHYPSNPKPSFNPKREVKKETPKPKEEVFVCKFCGCEFVPTSNYHKEEETIKSTKTHYPSNPKPSFNPKREVKKETPKPREEAFVCIFCGCAGHLDEFCFDRKRIEKRHFGYARNSYRNEVIDFPPHYYSHALSRFFYGPNHHSYGFGSREKSFVPRHFGYGQHSHHSDCFPRRHGFPAGGSYTHFEPRHLDGPCFPHRGSRPTGSNGEVQNTVKTSSGLMGKCWIPKIYLTNPSTKPSTSSRPM